MRYRHFEAFRPICPVCRDAETREAHRLSIANVLRAERESVLEGALNCTNPVCLREYPIIDGVPIIVPAIRSYISDNILPILSRTDLAESTESLIGDCCGPSSAFDTIRQQLSSYIWDHYGEMDPVENPHEPMPGALTRLLHKGLDAMGSKMPGPILDMGCSVGGSTFELAESTGELVLGVDLNFSKLRIASNVLHRGKVRYSRRRVGVVYDRREYPVSFEKQDAVDFWACDAAALPLSDGLFSLVVSLNLLDSIHSPVDHLRAVGRALALGGKALIGCPYDWSTSATAIEGWLGGHSQRGSNSGASETILRALLTQGSHPWSIPGLHLISELDWLPWQVQLHDRCTVSYRVHLVIAESRVQAGPPAKPDGGSMDLS